MQGILGMSIYGCSLYILCNVQYSFSPYIVGELTINHVTGFYCKIFTVFYR